MDIHGDEIPFVWGDEENYTFYLEHREPELVLPPAKEKVKKSLKKIIPCYFLKKK